jgi:hypothetical protein
LKKKRKKQLVRGRMRFSKGNRAAVVSAFWVLVLLSSVSHSFLSSSSTQRVIIPERFSFVTTTASTTNNGDRITVDPAASSSDDEEVSDAEALLACWSYLRKRRRLGNWTQLERRQAMKASAQPHFFWEEPDDEANNIVDDNNDNMDDDETLDLSEPRPDRGTKTDETTDEIWYGEFTSFPTEPTITRTRRSQAAKRTWADPEFRERWYQSRWGGNSNHHLQETIEKKTAEAKVLEHRVRSLPPGFFGSPELASMTEDEIKDAIRGYTQSGKKRSTSRAKTLEQRKLAIEKSPNMNNDNNEEQRLVQNSLYSVGEEVLREAKRKRSENAKKAYATRLKNNSKKDTRVPPPKPRKTYLPTSATPQDALLRIEDNLDRGTLPSVDDVAVIMKPLKLAKRRDLLRRILIDVFDLRGKCVPLGGDDPDSPNEFVTQAPIGDLGEFVIHLLGARSPEKVK